MEKKSLKKVQVILIFLFICYLNLSDGVCPPPENPLSCFSQQDFEKTLENAEIIYNATEEILINSLSIEGFSISEEESVYEHFRNHHIEKFVIDQNRYTTIMINALQTLKANGNYTKNQLRMCLKNITVPSYLPNVTLNCDPVTNK